MRDHKKIVLVAVALAGLLPLRAKSGDDGSLEAPAPWTQLVHRVLKESTDTVDARVFGYPLKKPSRALAKAESTHIRLFGLIGRDENGTFVAEAVVIEETKVQSGVATGFSFLASLDGELQKAVKVELSTKDQGKIENLDPRNGKTRKLFQAAKDFWLGSKKDAAGHSILLEDAARLLAEVPPDASVETFKYAALKSQQALAGEAVSSESSAVSTQTLYKDGKQVGSPGEASQVRRKETGAATIVPPIPSAGDSSGPASGFSGSFKQAVQGFGKFLKRANPARIHGDDWVKIGAAVIFTGIPTGGILYFLGGAPLAGAAVALVSFWSGLLILAALS